MSFTKKIILFFLLIQLKSLIIHNGLYQLSALQNTPMSINQTKSNLKHLCQNTNLSELCISDHRQLNTKTS